MDCLHEQDVTSGHPIYICYATAHGQLTNMMVLRSLGSELQYEHLIRDLDTLDRYLTTAGSLDVIRRKQQLLRTEVVPDPLYSPKIHCSLYKILRLIPFLSQMKPAHTLISHPSKIHFNIILPSTPTSPV
jgi:hypothetical protein